MPPQEAAAASFGDDRAVEEAKQFASGLSADQLARLAEAREYNRSQLFKDHFEWLAVSAMWTFALIILLIGGTWLFHLLSPERSHWLSPDGVSKVQNIFTGGIVAGLIADHFRKRMG